MPISNAKAEAAVTIRTHRIGDIGLGIERPGTLYWEEYGWNEEFEALVATLFAKFATQHDPAIERCWIAELMENGPAAFSLFAATTTPKPHSFAAFWSTRTHAASA